MSQIQSKAQERVELVEKIIAIYPPHAEKKDFMVKKVPLKNLRLILADEIKARDKRIEWGLDEFSAIAN